MFPVPRSQASENKLHKHVLLLLKLYVLEDKLKRLVAHVAWLASLQIVQTVSTLLCVFDIALFF